MDVVTNPFVPGAGTSPRELVGREGLLDLARVAFGRAKAGRPARSFVAVGLRGVGKTVLLRHVADLARQSGFRTSFVELHDRKPLAVLLVPQIRKLLLDLDRIGAVSQAVKHALRALQGFVGALKLKAGEIELALDFDPAPGTADSGELDQDLPDLFAALGKAAQSRGSAVALLLDEIQYLSAPDLAALIMAMHRCAQENLPVVMVAAGLPHIVALSGQAKSYAERLFDFPRVGALSASDAARAIVEPARAEGVEFTPAAVAAIVSVTAGYPYFLQEWGYQAWNLAQASPITAADIDVAGVVALDRLDASFFRVRFDRLAPRERDYARAMAELGDGPYRSGVVAKLLGKRPQAVGTLRQTLIDKGMIYSPAHGDASFTVPMFNQFLIRIMPDWAPDPVPVRGPKQLPVRAPKQLPKRAPSKA